jgi:hypothetical protein
MISRVFGGKVSLYDSKPWGIFDPEAKAFLIAAGITNPTISSATNTLVIDLKNYGLWNKMHAIYPFVGGDASKHKWNLKDPRDVNDAFRLSFNGGWTHTQNGIQGNGINAYADTFYIQSIHLPSQDDLHISLYSRSNISEVKDDMAVRDQANGPTTRTYIIMSRNLTTSFYVATNNSFDSFSNTNSLGHMITTRTSSNFFAAYRNGLLSKSSTTLSIRKAEYKIYIGNVSLENNPNPGGYTNKQFAFASIGLGLSGTDSLNFYNIIQNFQTILNRQV